jgi:hypothetical protein
MRRTLVTALFVLTIFLSCGAAHAVPLPLVNNGGGLIYDPNLNITWYDYTYKGSTGNGATWSQAMTWASSLTVGGASNWTLPTTLPVNGSTYNSNWSYDGSTDFSANISAPGSAYPGSNASQMAYLFYCDLGGSSSWNINGSPNLTSPWGLSNTGPFRNLAPWVYWSSSMVSPYDNPWTFEFAQGVQSTFNPSAEYYAMAVHAGDVGAPVPVPAAILLFLPGLTGLAALKRRYRA